MKIRNETDCQPLERMSGRPSPCVSIISLGVLLVFLILLLSACAPKNLVTNTCTIGVPVEGLDGTMTIVTGQQRELAMHGVKYVPLFEGRVDRPAYHGTGFQDANSPDLRPSDEWWLREGDTIAITMSDLRFEYDDGNTANVSTCNWCGTGTGTLGFGESCRLGPLFAANDALIEVLEFPKFDTYLPANRSLISGPALLQACDWFYPGRLPGQRRPPVVITPTRDATFEVQVPSDDESPGRIVCTGTQEKPAIKVHVFKPGTMTAVPVPLERFPSVMGEAISPDRRPFFSAATLGDPTKFKVNFSPDLEVDSVTLVKGFFEGPNFVATEKVPFDSLILAHGCFGPDGMAIDKTCLQQDDRCPTLSTDHSTIQLSQCVNRGSPQSFETTPAYRLNSGPHPPTDPLFWVVEFEGTPPPPCPGCTLYLVFNLK